MNADEPDASLEILLRGIPLREPTMTLDGRVNEVFAAAKYRRRRFHALAIAAGILIAIGIGVRLSLPRKAVPIGNEVAVQMHPIQIERDTSTVYDDGVIAAADDAVYQQFRRRTVREIWTIDPATHSQLKMVVPVEQVYVQKVDAY